MKRKTLVTGGTGVVGVALIKGLLKDGHDVVFTTRDRDKGQEIIDRLQLKGSSLSLIEVDFDASDALENLLDAMPGQVDSIVHNARNLNWLKLDHEGQLTKAQWQGELFMAVTFPYQLSNAMMSRFDTIRDIVFISSMYGHVAANPQLYTDFHHQSPMNYGVGKAAQLHLTREMAVRYAERSIRVNSISYGGIEGRVDAAFKKRYAQLNPLRRMLNESDIYPPLQ